MADVGRQFLVALNRNLTDSTALQGSLPANLRSAAGVYSTAQIDAFLLQKATKGANSDITSLSGLTTPLTPGQGGTGVSSLAALKSALSLNNVDNTSDANKPVSSATTAALGFKITGPSSSTAGNLLTFADTTGKVAADSGRILPSGPLLSDPTAATTAVATIDFNLTNIGGAPYKDCQTRATNGGYRQRASGLYVPTTTNEPVIDFSAGTALGTGFYGAYTNLLLRSEEFDHVTWTPNVSPTVTANAGVAPDGNMTADRFTLSADVSGKFQAFAATSGTTYTFSVFVAPVSGFSRVRLDFGGTAFATAFVVFNTATGAVDTSGGAALTIHPAQPMPGGGWRFSITATATATNTGAVSVYSWTSTATVFDVWGAQLTATAFPVPYIPTTSATVTRNADAFLLSGTDFTDNFNPREGTLFLDYQALPSINANLLGFTRGSGISGPRMQLAYNSSVTPSFAVVDDSSAVSASLSAGSAASGRIAASYSANSFDFALNGTLSTHDSSGSLPTGLVALEIGQSNAHIRRLIYWPKSLAAIDLQRMTAA